MRHDPPARALSTVDPGSVAGRVVRPFTTGEWIRRRGGEREPQMAQTPQIRKRPLSASGRKDSQFLLSAAVAEAIILWRTTMAGMKIRGDQDDRKRDG